MNNMLERINFVIGRYYQIFSIAVIGLVSLSMLNLFIWPQYQSMTDDGILQNQNMETVLQQRQSYLDDLKAMEINYLAMDQRIMRDVGVLLPTAYSEGTIYAELSAVVLDTEYQIDSINVSTLNADEPTVSTGIPYQMVSVSLNVSSKSEDVTYQDFKKLLLNIEQYPHLLDLEALSYSAADSNYTLLIKTYQQGASL